jgi:hypothetical protein
MCKGVQARRALMAARSSRRVEEGAKEAEMPKRAMPWNGDWWEGRNH